MGLNAYKLDRGTMGYEKKAGGSGVYERFDASEACDNDDVAGIRG